jgi:DNA topoisomerase IB
LDDHRLFLGGAAGDQRQQGEWEENVSNAHGETSNYCAVTASAGQGSRGTITARDRHWGNTPTICRKSYVHPEIIAA